MEIIRKGTDETNKFPVEIKCDRCKSLLKIDKSDAYIGSYGLAYVKCPVCNDELMLCDYNIWELDSDITTDNLVFPDHFYKFDADNPKDVEKEILPIIKRGIRWLRENPDYFDYSCSGKYFIHIHNFPGAENYSITVALEHYDIDIDYTDEDKKIEWQVDDD